MSFALGDFNCNPDNFYDKHILILIYDSMSKSRKKNIKNKNVNQLAFDFNQNVPIEIHIPKQITVNYKKEFMWSKKTAIQLVRS